MKFTLRVALLLLLVAATVMVKGSDLSDALNDDDANHEADAGHRAKRRISAFNLFDHLRGKGASTAKPTAGGGGFNLADGLRPDPKPSKPAGGNDFGFKLDDALRPAVKPSGGDCQVNMVQTLSKVIENQDQELRLLQQLMARSSRFNGKR